MKTTWKARISLWAPTAFCVLLSFTKLFSERDTGDAAFFSFLPLCFFIVAVVQLSLWNRIERLEARVAEHELGSGGPGGT